MEAESARMTETNHKFHYKCYNKMERLTAISERLETEMDSMKERIAFVEKIHAYKNILRSPYREANHIPGKDMVRLIEMKIIFGRGFNVNLYPYLNDEKWEEHATEDELLDVIIAVMARKDYTTISLFGGVYFVCSACDDGDVRRNYQNQMEKLKKYSEQILIHQTHGYEYKKFVESHVKRLRNVLTKLHEMGLLK